MSNGKRGILHKKNTDFFCFKIRQIENEKAARSIAAILKHFLFVYYLFCTIFRRHVMVNDRLIKANKNVHAVRFSSFALNAH